MKTRIIGDIHGDYYAYQLLIDGCERSIQVGDFGIGFVEDNFDRNGSHKFIRGNHDDPSLCKRNDNWIADGTMVDNIFCVGGGYSIDKDFRTPGVSWWEDEELSQADMYRVLDIYEEIKPEYVITHEGPADLIEVMFSHKPIFRPLSRTSQFLNSMFHIHQPKVWVFGHWHESLLTKMNNTDFMSGINAYIDLKH